MVVLLSKGSLWSLKIKPLVHLLQSMNKEIQSVIPRIGDVYISLAPLSATLSLRHYPSRRALFLRFNMRNILTIALTFLTLAFPIAALPANDAVEARGE